MADINLYFINYSDVETRRHMPTGLLAFHASTKTPLAEGTSALSGILRRVYVDGVRYAIVSQIGKVEERVIKPRDLASFDKYIVEFMRETKMKVEKQVVPAPLRPVFKLSEALRLIDSPEGETVEITKVTV